MWFLLQSAGGSAQQEPALGDSSFNAGLHSSSEARKPRLFLLLLVIPLLASARRNANNLLGLFRQLRSFPLFRSFVGSHISAFHCCKSQSHERVSQSMISLNGYGRFRAYPCVDERACADGLLACALRCTCGDR